MPMHLRARDNVARYLRERPEVEGVEVGRPLVVTGLHRTGYVVLVLFYFSFIFSSLVKHPSSVYA